MELVPSGPPSDDPRIGTVVAERYRLTAKLGEGGMGAVYRGVHEALRKAVAVKFLVPAARADKELVARFEREAVAMANLKHPNISEATDFGQLPDGTLFLVMEYVDGKNLREVTARSPLAPERALVILEQVAAALTFAHEHDVVHRDLKPDNVIVFDRKSERDRVKVIDFGIARMSSAFGGGHTALTKAGTVFGTPDYMAPEQAMGDSVDARADQYALGAMAYELFTGRRPYSNENVTALMFMHVGAPIPRIADTVPSLPPALSDVVEKMMGKLPAERYPSVADAVGALRDALHAVGESAMAAPAATAPMASPAPPQSTPQPGPDSGLRRAAKTAVIPRPSLPTPTPPSAAPASATPASATSKPFPIYVVSAAAVVVVAFLGVVLLVAWIAHRASGSKTTTGTVDRSEVTAALAQWKHRDYAAAATALEGLVARDPSLAEDDTIAATVGGAVDEPAAESAIQDMMAKSSFGGSHALAATLAGVAIHGGASQRDAALRVLHGRHATLDPEPRARVELRDADDCDDLEAAKGSLTSLSTRTTSEDLALLGGPDCKNALRKRSLCDECRGPGGKGGKKHPHPHD